MKTHQKIELFLKQLFSFLNRGKREIAELNQKSSKVCPIKFTIHLLQNLELSQSTFLLGLILARRAIVSYELKVSKKSINQLIIACLILAEKCYEDEQSPIEAYSLFSGFSIKQLVMLQSQILMLLRYSLIIDEAEFKTFFPLDEKEMIALD